MSYQTGVATDPDDLLDKLRLFLIAEGWTVDGWAADTYTRYTYSGMNPGNGYRLHVHKGSAYFNFRSCIRNTPFYTVVSDSVANGAGYYAHEVTGIAMNGSTGYNGSLAWYEQPGAPQRAGTGGFYGVAVTRVPTSGIPAYIFFTVGQTVGVVVEIATNEFQWLLFGTLAKAGSYTGGMFYTGSNPGYAPETAYLESDAYGKGPFENPGATYYARTGVYLDGVDGYTGWRLDVSSYLSAKENLLGPLAAGALESTSGAGWNGSLLTALLAKEPNALNGNVALLPLYHCVGRSSGMVTYVGYPEGLAAVRMDYVNPKDEITLGSDTWVLLASLKKGTGYSNQNLGLAVKKVV